MGLHFEIRSVPFISRQNNISINCLYPRNKYYVYVFLIFTWQRCLMKTKIVVTCS